jgi:hypothetical protein
MWRYCVSDLAAAFRQLREVGVVRLQTQHMHGITRSLIGYIQHACILIRLKTELVLFMAGNWGFPHA